MSPTVLAQLSQREAVACPVATIDLDASATTTPTAAVIAAVTAAMSTGYGNPSSGHHRGARSRQILTMARESIAKLSAGAFDDGVHFTSGCTEANNLVLSSFAKRGVPIITSAVEHPSVLAAALRIRADGGNVTILDVDDNGQIDLDRLRHLLGSEKQPGLVSVQIANSETGIVQDIVGIAKIVALHPGTVFHADAAQALGKLDLALGPERGPDILTMSGHKINAPMGIGALVVADASDVELLPLLLGGGQENGLRAGTQAVPAIAGLGAAADEWLAFGLERRTLLAAMRDKFEQRIAELPGVKLNGQSMPRVPHISNITFQSIDAMALLAHLDARGIAVSQGSACSNGRPEASPVLRAMGLSEADAFSTLRFSFSIQNDMAQVERAAPIVADTVAGMRAHS